jgi:hypothetical protein
MIRRYLRGLFQQYRPTADVGGLILLCCTTQPRDALCKRVTLVAPDDVIKLLFAERDVMEFRSDSGSASVDVKDSDDVAPLLRFGRRLSKSAGESRVW